MPNESIRQPRFKPNAVVLRSDLIHQQLELGDRTIWVTKDPISGDFFYFSPREFTILSALDGRSSEAISAAYREQHCNEFISSEMLVAFLAQVQKSGLLRTAGFDPNRESNASPHGRQSLRSGLLSPLSIRLPGIDPDRLLNWSEPKLRWLMTPLACWIAVCCMFVAMTIIGLRADQFFSELRDAQAWTSADMILLIGVVIAATKVAHELAHAMVCRRYGGSCHEMGLMLLVFVPCLYCDVSDAWLQPQRRKRIAISAAGMFAELSIAAVAAILWSITLDGPLHWICLSVVVVCSISTVVFNGNPLMRYDGYYILSDLLRIPNLAAQSSVATMRRLKQWLTGIRSASHTDHRLATEAFLIIYSIASVVYRLIVVGAIVLAIHKLASSYQFRIAAWLLTSVILMGVLRGMYNQVRQFKLSTWERRSMRPKRVWGGCLFAAATVIGLLLIPLPKSIRLPFFASGVDQHKIYVTQPGQLSAVTAEGVSVSVGDTIAVLQNREFDLELESLHAEAVTLRERLDRAHSLRSSNPEVAAQIPALTDLIAATNQKIMLLRRERESMAIKATASGVLFAAPNKMHHESENGSIGWSGTLLQPKNLGCFVPRDTHFCSIGSPQVTKIALMISHRQIDFVRIGQEAVLHFPGADRSKIRAIVRHVDVQPIEQVDRELVVNRLISIDPVDAGKDRPLEPTYQIHVELSETSITIPLRCTGIAHLSVEPQSILHRFTRFLADSIRFDLR